jgi:hypothetical protein
MDASAFDRLARWWARPLRRLLAGAVRSPASRASIPAVTPGAEAVAASRSRSRRRKRKTRRRGRRDDQPRAPANRPAATRRLAPPAGRRPSSASSADRGRPDPIDQRLAFRALAELNVCQGHGVERAWARCSRPVCHDHDPGIANPDRSDWSPLMACPLQPVMVAR